jgi:hypothetical protein
VILEMVAAGVFLLVGLLSAIGSVRSPTAMGETGRDRFLVAVHDAAKAGFWLTLGGFFLIFGLIDEPQDFRWFALVPVGMAGLRLATAYFLARS